jgi:hypothetical protein
MRGNTGSKVKDAPDTASLSSYFNRTQAKMGDLSAGIPVRAAGPHQFSQQNQVI